jgi:phosphate-selective porin OprO/OprP
VRGSDALTGNQDDLDLARRRVGVHGTVKNLVEFQVERELDDNSPWRDVFLNYRQYEAAEIQAGQFKVPFSLDENTSATNLDFVYRSMIASHLAPGRDAGVMAHGRVARRMLRYEVGWFAHDGRNARTHDQQEVYGDTTFAGRLTVRPVRKRHSPFRDLQFGIAYTGSQVAEGFPGLKGHTVLDAPFFPSNFWVDGQRRRIGLEARWRPGPASIKAEYIRLSTERLGQSVEDTDLRPLVAQGWYVSGTYAITGEKKADDLTTPRKPLFQGGWGAIELAARLEALSFGTMDDAAASTSPRADVVLGNADHAATFGVNWYPMRRIKVQMNVIRESIADPLRGPSPDKPSFWSRLLTFQLDL